MCNYIEWLLWKYLCDMAFRLCCVWFEDAVAICKEVVKSSKLVWSSDTCIINIIYNLHHTINYVVNNLFHVFLIHSFVFLIISYQIINVWFLYASWSLLLGHLILQHIYWYFSFQLITIAFLNIYKTWKPIGANWQYVKCGIKTKYDLLPLSTNLICLS